MVYLFRNNNFKQKLMKRIFYIIAILLVILIGAYLQYIFCCGGCTGNSNAGVVAEKVTPKTTNFKDFFIKDGDVSVTSTENFNFLPSSYAFIRPIGVNLKAKIDEVKNYSLQNPNKHLTITGYYADFEKNNSVFPNLGVARANAVKKYFVDRGLDGKKLHLAGELTNDIKEGVSPLKGIVAYNVVTVDDKTASAQLEELKAFGKQLKKEPITVYFETGSSYIDLTPEERNKVQKISDYIEQVEGAHILIVGHTDNVGNANKNKELARKRAEFVKKYFVQNSFDANVIDVDSKGQEKPIASNKTKEGRAKNRRVEITLK